MRCIVIAALLLAACGAEQTGAQPPVNVQAQPLETRPANSPYKPALPGQTRAPLKTAGVKFAVQTLAEGLDHPWGLDFLPGGQMLVTERPGRLRIVGARNHPLARKRRVKPADIAKYGFIMPPPGSVTVSPSSSSVILI